MDQSAGVSGTMPSLMCLVLVSGVMAGCGVVGPPIPPEMVGVAPIIERQKRLESSPGETAQPLGEAQPADGSENMGPAGQDEVLPPLRPIGTR